MFIIKYRITHNRQVGYISSKYSVPQEAFDQENGKVIPVRGTITPDKAKEINKQLMIQVTQLYGKCDSQKNIRFMDIKNVMALLRDNKAAEKDLISMISNRIEELDKMGNYNYVDSYKRTKGILEEFAGTFIRFEAVDYNFIKRLEIHMKTMLVNKNRENERTGLSKNSVGIHMRNIRTMYNRAITMGLVDYSYYPFRKYNIERGDTRHRTIEVEQVVRLYRLQITDPLTAWARDMAMLSFFLIGINMKDMMELRSIQNGRIRYDRSKGHRKYDIKVEPEAQEIINRYRGKDYLLNTLEKYSYYSYATKRINKRLKDVAKDCGIKEELTTYYFRHSWATIAYGLGIPMDDISQALGHQSQELEMTQIYVKESIKRVDDANRMVIDYILSIT